MEKNKKSQPIFRRMLIPINAVVMLQVLLLVVGVWRSSLLSRMNENACIILGERLNASVRLLEDNLSKRWTSLDYSLNNISQYITDELNLRGATYSDIMADYALNEQLVLGTADDMIDLLRRNAVTGAFVVLDGPSVRGKQLEESRAGFYIRDLDPDERNHSSNNISDVLVLCGLPSVSKEKNLPLDTYWRAGFEIGQERSDSNDFFYHPLQKAREDGATFAQSLNYACWSVFSIPGEKKQAIAYTVPLITKQDEVIGVLGIEVSPDYLSNFLNYKELGMADRSAYVIAHKGASDLSYDVAVYSGMSQRKMLSERSEITLHGQIYEGIYKADLPGGDTVGKAVRLNTYATDTVFAHEEWYLISLVARRDLLSFSRETIQLLGGIGILAFVLSIFSAVVASKVVSSPISELSSRLLMAKPDRPIKLGRIHIDEIDQLSSAVEKLSEEMDNNARTISRILRMTRTPIGVFEYKTGSSEVYCTGSLCEMLGWELIADDFIYLSAEAFGENMEMLEQEPYAGEGILYRMGKGSDTRYYELMSYKDEHAQVGAITDITSQILDMRKIEIERDHDPLTMLLNYKAFSKKVQLEMQRLVPDSVCAMMMMDMDNLKFINDSYGHHMGDQYITQMADVLHAFDGEQCVVSRRSGDEFLMFFYGFESKASLMLRIEEAIKKIRVAKVTLPDGGEAHLSVSIGYAFWPEDSSDMNTLLRYADFAMYQGKNGEKNASHAFDRSTYDSAVRELTQAELPEAQHSFWIKRT